LSGWWFYKAVQDGEAYGDAINGLTDHVKYWPQFQKSHPELRSMEYRDVPRGRVMFMKPSRKFHRALHPPDQAVGALLLVKPLAALPALG
jgi:hypothetical protein